MFSTLSSMFSTFPDTLLSLLMNMQMKWALLQYQFVENLTSPFEHSGCCKSYSSHLILIIIIIIIITMTTFIVLSSWHSHCESSLGSCSEYIMVPSGCQPLDQANLLSKPTYIGHGCHLLSLLSPKSDTHFTVPQNVEGRVDLGGCYIPRWFAHP